MFKWLWRRKRHTKESVKSEQGEVQVRTVGPGGALTPSESTIRTEISPASADFSDEPVSPFIINGQQSDPVSQPASKEQPFETDCFKLVRPVLEELRTQISSSRGDRTWGDIYDAIRTLRESYNSASAYKRVDYKGTLAQFAYLHSYAPSRASILFQIMNEHEFLAELVSRETLKVASFGGGPGTDVLGVLKLRQRRKGRAIIDVTIYDNEDGWENVWRRIESTTETARYAHVDFCIGDMLGQDWSMRGPWDAELAIMSYSFSELSGQSAASKFLGKLADAATSGTLFLIVDNGHSHIMNAVETAIDTEGLVKRCPMQCKTMRVEDREKGSATDNWNAFARGRPLGGFQAKPHQIFKLAYWILEKP